MSLNVFLEVAAVAELHLTDVAREPSTFVVRLEQMSVELVGGSEALRAGAALHQGAPRQMIWLEDPPPCLLLCFGNSVNSK